MPEGYHPDTRFFGPAARLYASAAAADIMDPSRMTLADQIRDIVARLRDINEYDRQRLCDIAVAVAKRERMLEDR